MVGLVAALLVANTGFASAVEAAKPDWDRIANVKAAAQQIGEIQKTKGVDAAYKFISACYKTHGLSSQYSRWFEGCIAQDYIQSRTLALVYERLPAAQLKTMGAPSATEVIEALRRRLGAAFAQYKIPPADGQAFLTIVEAQGIPIFMKAVFPEQAR